MPLDDRVGVCWCIIYVGVCLCIYVGSIVGCMCETVFGMFLCRYVWCEYLLLCVWCATSTPTLCVFVGVCYVGCDDTKCVCALVCETYTVRMSMCVCLSKCTGSISRFSVYNCVIFV